MGRGRRAFTPKTTLEAEALLASFYDGPVFDGPIEIEVELHSDHYRITIAESPREKSRLRGDIDNYLKLVLDALQGGVAFDNDRQVMGLSGWKR